MDCEQVTERLPWLLNRTLTAEEDEQVRAHLRSCASCAGDLEQVRLAAQVFGAHLSPGSLIELAWEGPLAGIDADLAHRHIESCVSCAGELALARESRRLEAAAPRRAPRAASWRWAAVAAALPLAFAGGMLWRATPDSPGAATAAAEKQRLEARVADLQGEVDRLAAPQPNVPVVEVFPDSLALRSTRASQNRVVVDAEVAWVVLLLSSGRASADRVVVEVRDQAGSTIWRGSGLKAGSLGGYTLAVPSPLLPDGRHVLVISTPEGRVIDSYALDVSRVK